MTEYKRGDEVEVSFAGKVHSLDEHGNVYVTSPDGTCQRFYPESGEVHVTVKPPEWEHGAIYKDSRGHIYSCFLKAGGPEWQVANWAQTLAGPTLPARKLVPEE